jgi:hypothetical protein
MRAQLRRVPREGSEIYLPVDAVPATEAEETVADCWPRRVHRNTGEHRPVLPRRALWKGNQDRAEKGAGPLARPARSLTAAARSRPRTRSTVMVNASTRASAPRMNRTTIPPGPANPSA